MENKTFHNLQVLETARQTVKENLGKKYSETIQPFVDIITMVMRANACDKFTALKKIKDSLDIYKQENAPLYFSAAIMEIVEEDHFQEIKKESWSQKLKKKFLEKNGF